MDENDVTQIAKGIAPVIKRYVQHAIDEAHDPDEMIEAVGMVISQERRARENAHDALLAEVCRLEAALVDARTRIDDLERRLGPQLVAGRAA